MRFIVEVSKLANLKRKLQKFDNKYPNVLKYEEIGITYQTKNINKVYFNGQYCELGRVASIKVKCMEIEVEGEYKLDNWEFAATLEHLTPQGNVIRNISDHILPKKFYTCGPKCEHCNTIRDRKDTFVVYNNKTNEFKQVGKKCLREYTGLDATVIASYNSFISEAIASDICNSDDVYYPNSNNMGYENEYIKSIAYYFVSNFGYRKNGSNNSTKEQISEYIIYNKNHYIIDFDKIKSKISKIDEWYKKFEASSEFLHNVKTVYESEIIEYRDISYLAYAIHLYLSQPQQASTSDYLGNVGDRIKSHIIGGRILCENYSYYENTFLWELVDDKGNILIWSTTKKDLFYYCNNFNLISTIKSLKTYRNIKQTVVTRGRVETLANI